MPIDLRRVGIWSRELRYQPDRGARAAAAAELEELGYAAIFIPDAGGGVLAAAERLLAATRRVPVVTGVLNIWMHDPADVARGCADLVTRFGPRFLPGIGNSHAPLVESALREPYVRPYSTMVRYLDALDAAVPPVPAGQRMLAALGPGCARVASAHSGIATRAGSLIAASYSVRRQATRWPPRRGRGSGSTTEGKPRLPSAMLRAARGGLIRLRLIS